MEFLNSNHRDAILMLTAGRSTKEISVKLGVTQRCIELWKNDPDFASLLRESCTKAFEASHAELMLHTQKAVFELQNILDDPDTPTRLRLSAIQIMLQYGLKSTKETALSKLNSVNQEEILDYFLKHGDEEQVFKALEFKRKNQEFQTKNQDKILLSELKKTVSNFVEIVQKYIPQEKMMFFMMEIEKMQLETASKATK